ncbi:MAG TPA: TraG family conjugative transposon ATPase [Puia sp.]|nr:TraG family conjugative transposon ATPase [Puia sp.]
MSRKESGSLPKMEFFEHILINEYGDLTIGFQRNLRESLSSSAEQCDADVNAYTKALKALGPDYIVHVQDRYHRAYVDTPVADGESKGSLALASSRHFHERPYLEHRSYLFITLTCGSRRPPVGGGSALFRRRLVPRQALDLEKTKKLKQDCLLFARILEENSDIRCRVLEPSEYTGTVDETGLCEQYALLQSPDAPPQTADLEVGPDYRVGNKHVAVYTICDADFLPAECSPFTRYDRYSTERTLFPLGTGAWFGSMIDAEHICNLYLVLVEPAATLKRLETRRRRMHSLAKVDPENAISEKDIAALQEEAAKGEQQLLRMHVSLIAWTEEKAELSSLQSKLVVAIGKTGATPHLETVGAGRVVLAGMPGNAGSLMISETFLTFAAQAACFVIGESNGRSASGPFGIRLGDRATGVPLHVDISDEPLKKGLINNRNKFVEAPSGSGKSYLMNHLVRCYLETRAHVLLLDIGGSYKTLCSLMKGRYFAFAEDQKMQFNPFLLGEGELLDTEKKESLKALLIVLWKMGNEPLIRSEYVALSNLLEAWYGWLAGKPDIFPCMDTLYEWLMDDYARRLEREGVREKDFDLKNFLYVLRPYYCGGEYDWLLNAREQMNLLQEPFIVFELDAIKDHPILFPVVTIVIMELFVSKMRKLHGIRKVIILEEAWKAIAKEGMSEYIKYLFKTVRKFFGEAIVVTQDLDDITGNPIVKNSIINNADCKILLDQSKFANRFDQIQEVLGLTEQDKAMILSLNRANDPAYRYKEVFISLGTNHSRVYRVEVSLEEHLAYTTEEKERVKVNEYARRHKGLMKGILALAADIRSGATQLLMAGVLAAVFMVLPNGRASAQIIDIIEDVVKEALEQADLKIQELQTQTLYLQNAEKDLENSMTGGLLDDISGWVQQQEDLYSEYYTELWQVKTAVSSYSKVTALISRQGQLVRDYQRATAAVRQDTHFSPEEVSHILKVYGGILDESIRNTGQLSLVINDFVTQMDDAARLRIIDDTGAGIDRNYADLRQYTQQNTLLSLRRAKDENDIQAIKLLYGIP